MNNPRQFLYFVVPPAGKPTLSWQECAEYGLSHAFDERRRPNCCRTGSGPRPDNSSGLVLCSSTDRIGYYPERQKWRAMHGNPSVWIGMELAHVPTPADLARQQQADGEYVNDAIGNRWLVPRARQYEVHESGQVVYHETLPAVLDVNDAGQWVRGDVISQYQHLWLFANQIADGKDVIRDDVFSAAFAANYHATAAELALLGAIDTQGDLFNRVLDVVMDEIRGLELLKKTGDLAAEMSIGSNGATQPTPDDEPDTGPLYQSREHGRPVYTGVA